MTISAYDRYRAARFVQAWSQGPLRRLLAALPDRPGTSIGWSELVDASGLTPREAAPAAARAHELGLVHRDGDRWSVATDRLAALAEALVADSPAVAMVAAHPALAAFVTAGRLTGWPTRPGLEDECWTAIAEQLPRSDWTESELNSWLATFADDPAALRRGLVERGHLHRSAGSDRYTRC